MLAGIRGRESGENIMDGSNPNLFAWAQATKQAREKCLRCVGEMREINKRRELLAIPQFTSADVALLTRCTETDKGAGCTLPVLRKCMDAIKIRKFFI
jgi:hypothetical protein